MAVAANSPSQVPWQATSNGLFCPPQIKGFNELKPQGTGRGSMPVDSFQEWLRYQGYWRCANVVSDSDNIRVYVPIPMRITPRAVRASPYSWNDNLSSGADQSQMFWQ
jgi:hypothetical protein